MSKQSEAKKEQGFQKDSPKCSNCKYFRSEIEILKTNYGDWTREINLRCFFGNFKVGKSNWCKCYSPKPNQPEQNTP